VSGIIVHDDDDDDEKRIASIVTSYSPSLINSDGLGISHWGADPKKISGGFGESKHRNHKDCVCAGHDDKVHQREGSELVRTLFFFKNSRSYYC
jgi:hypothetical protein